jgi:hypothetical protein
MSSTYWSEQFFFRPLFIHDDVWNKIFNNFLIHVGAPLEGLPGAL